MMIWIFTLLGITDADFPYISFDREASIFIKQEAPLIPDWPAIASFSWLPINNAPELPPSCIAINLLACPTILGSPAVSVVPILLASPQARKAFECARNNCNAQPLRAWCQVNSIGASNDAGLPNATGYIHRIIFNTHESWKDAGALRITENFDEWLLSGNGGFWTGTGRLNIDLSSSNSIYGNSDTIMPSSINIPVIIYLGK